jgi:hypothetical protein
MHMLQRSLLPAPCAVLTLVAILVLPAQIQAGWLTGWDYRRAVSLANPSGSDLTGYQAQVVLDAGFDFAHAAFDGADLRVTAADEVTEIPFWLESWDPAHSVASIWVQAPFVPVGGTTVFLYYGNPGAPSRSDGDAVFAAYDGFEAFAAGNPGEWARSPANPMLIEGPAGSWDASGATFASVIRDESAGEFRMYYHGFAGSVHQIGLATSPDGLHWTKYPGNPILTPGPQSWDGGSVRTPMVWKEGSVYQMIYTGLGLGGEQFGYAHSLDGITWTKYAGNPVFNDPTWAHNQTECWGVIKADGQYVAWYDTGGMRQSGLAVSSDLIHWSPAQPGPVFASSGDPSDPRYSQYCPFTFRYNDLYYVLMCSYDGGSNYGSLYLYRSSSPFFPETDRQLVRIAHTVGPEGSWDDHDSDTPCVLTLDIERAQFYNNQLWCYYSAEGGGAWQEGLHLETDLASALADTAVPEMEWHSSGQVSAVNTPARQGSWSMRQNDTNAGGATQLWDYFTPRQKGSIGAWLRRDSTSPGDYDLYLYGNGATPTGGVLACAAGLGRGGDFHYWEGVSPHGGQGFRSTGVAWTLDTWYLVAVAFDAGALTYSFSVYDENLGKLLEIRNIAFGDSCSTLDQAAFYSSALFTGSGYVDDYRLREWCGADIGADVLAEETPADVPAGPAAVRLDGCVPNPFRSLAEIGYTVIRSGPVRLEVFDLFGRKVATVVDDMQSAGSRAVPWNGVDDRGRRLAAGVYSFRLTAGSRVSAGRITIVK